MNDGERNRIIIEHFKEHGSRSRPSRLIDSLMPVEPLPEPPLGRFLAFYPEGCVVVEDEWDDVELTDCIWIEKENK